MFPAVAFALLALLTAPDAEPVFEAGFAKIDVTPAQPLRLAGYADRAAPFEGIDAPLFARAVAIRHRTEPDAAPLVLVSLDSMGLPTPFGAEIARRVEAERGVPRARFALCVTHSHSTPYLETGRPSVFAVPVTDAQRARSAAYTNTVADGVLKAAGAAIADLRPARLAVGTGEATFAVNRRTLRDGKWVVFGVNPEAPVDHALPVLRVTDPDGTVRGVIFNYACHATTLTGETNRVSGDWPGFAAANLEKRYPGAVALCTIGTGADANPHPRGRLSDALAHAKTIAEETAAVLKMPLRPVTSAPAVAFGAAPLPFDRYSREELERMNSGGDRFERQYAAVRLAAWEDEGPPPETYPAPAQVWRFGDDLTMVFLGGEVVVDYGLRLKEELAASADPGAAGPVWVTAYANDVFAYVPSDRVLREGGYEAESSMLFYLKPGPFRPGVEAILIDRVKTLAADAAGRGE